jgi:hypothetical protein
VIICGGWGKCTLGLRGVLKIWNSANMEICYFEVRQIAGGNISDFNFFA